MTMKGLLLCAAVFVSTNVTAMSLFTNSEQANQRANWGVIQKYCQGCWSGAMSVCRTTRRNTNKQTIDGLQLEVVEPPTRNFRLRVQTEGDAGTWTVWNWKHVGHEATVPLSRSPARDQQQPPTQFTISFDCGHVNGGGGITLRIPRIIPPPSQPLFVFELGFWDDIFRKTGTLRYEPSHGMQSRWKLSVVSIMQLRKERNHKNFEGNTTDPKAVSVLPESASFQLHDIPWNELDLMQSEVVQLGTMQRSVDKRASIATKIAVRDRIAQCMMMQEAGQDASMKKERHSDDLLQTVLCNDICVSAPQEIVVGGSDNNEHPTRTSTCKFIFARRCGEQVVQALEIEYYTASLEATSVGLHTFAAPT